MKRYAPMPFFDPITLEQIVTLYIEGMAIEDIGVVLATLTVDEINLALDHILPHL